MGLRLRLVLALLGVALAPLALFHLLSGPAFDALSADLLTERKQAALARLDDGALRLEVAEEATDLTQALATARISGELDVDELVDEGEGYVTRRRRERERRIVAEMARELGVERFQLVHRGRVVFAVPAEVASSPPAHVALSHAPGWSYDADRDRLQLSAGGVLHASPLGPVSVITERAHSLDEVASLFAKRSSLDVGVRGLLPGSPPPAPPAENEVVAYLRAGDGRPVAALEAEIAFSSAPVARIRSSLTAALVVGALLAVVLAPILAAALARPVRRLALAVGRVADDPALASPMPRAGGEVGRLALAVERMLAALGREHARRSRAERTAAWQEVARRVAHEVRNPLTPIRLAMDNLRRARRRGPDALDACVDDEARTVLEEVERLERLVREFSDFARLPQPRPRPTDPVELVRRVVAGQVGDGGEIEVRMDVDAAPSTIDADPDLLGMAVANLARNSALAMGGHGRLDVAVRPRDGEGGARGVEIALEDDGPGIPEDLVETLFDPYVTGRGDRGTGLGLAIVRQVILEHGGTVRAENRAEGGARLSIWIPLERSEA